MRTFLRSQYLYELQIGWANVCGCPGRLSAGLERRYEGGFATRKILFVHAHTGLCLLDCARSLKVFATPLSPHVSCVGCGNLLPAITRASNVGANRSLREAGCDVVLVAPRLLQMWKRRSLCWLVVQREDTFSCSNQFQRSAPLRSVYAITVRQYMPSSLA